jgi:hypothetical protein
MHIVNSWNQLRKTVTAFLTSNLCKMGCFEGLSCISYMYFEGFGLKSIKSSKITVLNTSS